MRKHWNIISILIIISILLAGFVVGWLTRSVFEKNVVTKQLREDSSEYKFINPLLLVTNTGAGDASEYKSITKTLVDYVDNKITQKKAEDVSIYFRDLNTGLYSGVNEDHLYSPASMMKVAVLISCLRLSENEPSILDEKISMATSSDDFNKNQTYLPKHPIVKGKLYSVRDLIYSMVVESDNNATALLEYFVGDDKVVGLLKELQMPDLPKGDVDFMSPRLYSRLYRILYNSTYLSPDVSEETLKLLTQKGFPQGLVSGVPENIVVAEKFGEHVSVDMSGKPTDRQLHDCGIVYLPNNPYFLCVMTKGQDFKELQPIISDVSKIVWDYFSKVNNK